ncbi:Solanesyl-diphosphate synthase 1 mitochondrial [Bienertia sinuspersici]
MSLSRGFSRISRTRLNLFQLRYSCLPASNSALAAYHHSLCNSNFTINSQSTYKYVWGATENTFCSFPYDVRHHIHHSATTTVEVRCNHPEQSDPFSLVADELSLLADRLRSMVVAEVPKLASAAEYFFKMGVEGKRFRPTVLLLMATALNTPESMSAADRVSPGSLDYNLGAQLRTRQQRIAEVTEMIHVASLLHDDVLDDADTRRGVSSLNSVMGNKVILQYYMEKTYYKTASLISNSCKAVALLAGQTAEVATLAHEYGKNLVSCTLSI